VQVTAVRVLRHGRCDQLPCYGICQVGGQRTQLGPRGRIQLIGR